MKKGWKTKTLGEVCSFLNRGISPRYLERGGICVLNQKCVRDHRVSYEPSRRHDAQAKKVGSDRLIQAGDVLVNSTGTGTLGRVAQLRENPPEPTTVDSHVTIVRSTPGKFYSEFFGYMLIVIEDAIKEAGEGCGGQTELARSVLAEKFSVHYPESLPEQQRIVGILDEAFEGIATAKANAEKNFHSARALFESHLQSVFTGRGNGWVEKPLGDLASFRNGINYTKDSKGERIKIVGVRNFQKHFSAPLDDLDTVTIDGKLSELDSLKKDDILAVRSNGNIELIGRCILVGEVTEKISHSGFTIRIRLSNGSVIPKYVCHFMKSAGSRKLLTEGGTGTNIKSLNQGMLSALAIPFPPIAAQKVLVEQLESLSEETHRLKSIYQQKLAALESLKKSLLHQAFSGAL